MSTSTEDVPTEPPSAAGTSTASELLACVTCRTRKLKCDRVKPICTRCAKVKNADCVYPESRRKPAFKRRNVKELEERLAQVEGLLQNVAKKATGQSTKGKEIAPDGESTSPVAQEDATASFDFPDVFSSGSPEETIPLNNFSRDQPFLAQAGGDSPEVSSRPQHGGGLMGLGRFESLPPIEVIEDLHKIFFMKQQHFIPIIHEGNYLRAFYSAPHMRPPMCLQYAIWTMAANGHEKYGFYHDVFYQRTRQYLEADELKGYGEHFITVSHAQAWALTATDEARCMFFTRAAMSSARCVRLIEMMGLHRLDDTLSEEDNPMAPTLAPPQSWVELEERRRIFWGAFCIDSHASISTGWPSLIDINEVTTHLPSSQDAFNSGQEEEAPTLQQALGGKQYSIFAGAVVICHIFNQLLKHVHRPMPNDRPDDPEYGQFWKRHRELDNTLSSAFMFLPERFRLPRNIRDPVSVNTNLNLHASIICLHNAACDKVDTYKLSGQLKQMSKVRTLTAAGEIVNIMKLTSHMNSEHRTPLVSLSLYCAASVYIYQAKENPGECEVENLEFLIKCMEAIGREHIITRAYLNQVLVDIERNGLSASLNLPTIPINPYCAHNIPLLARNSMSRHTKLQPPLPGRLPLGKPQGNAFEKSLWSDCFANPWHPSLRKAGLAPEAGSQDTGEAGGNKRKRASSPWPSGSGSGGASSDGSPGALGSSRWFTGPGHNRDAAGLAESLDKRPRPPGTFMPSESSIGAAEVPLFVPSEAWTRHMKLPHRTTESPSASSSPSVISRPTPTTTTTTTSTAAGTGDSQGSKRMAYILPDSTGQPMFPQDEARINTGISGGPSVDVGEFPDLSLFPDLGMDQWDITDTDAAALGSMYEHVPDDVVLTDPWTLLHDNSGGGDGSGDGGAGGSSSWNTGGEGCS
ncbi:citrinin biosynthesis transcriptional activator ctnR [Diplogelasinospora grovesii]|uniref:Citrinin biosynthesis transcriptional activator ctnR n=1 Tax=Diplogelasinospora grovesii TaxID=303347 RepID=A0AAN6S5Z9_9PEZI|nr:citrinin biosynthesis transcriptional activator ctnR [Diplogelasinospora grovesii]